MNPNPLILIVDDERPIRNFLRIALSLHDYRIIEAENAEQGLSLASSHVPDLVILDLGLPDLDGNLVLKKLRTWTRMPVVVLSAREREKDKVLALDAGADDYLTKPFGVDELIARVRVALRHAASFSPDGQSPIYRHGDLSVDLEKREARRGDAEIHLTPIEFRLLASLVHHAGRVVTHGQLLQEVWGPGRQDQHQYLRVYMASLRRKLETDASRPQVLTTEVGVGYRLEEETEREVPASD